MIEFEDHDEENQNALLAYLAAEKSAYETSLGRHRPRSAARIFVRLRRIGSARSLAGIRYPWNMYPQPQTEIRAKILSYGQKLKESVDRHRATPDNWHTTLLLALAGELLFNCKEVLDGETEGNCCRSAWGARNLLELHYWVRYVTASRENARRFHEDLVCDYQDLLKHAGNGPGLDELVGNCKSMLQEMSAHFEEVRLEEKRLNVREIAKQFNDEVGYARVSKVLSKFVHPTSLSIQLRLLPPLIASLIVPLILQIAGMIIERTFPVLTDALSRAPNDRPESGVQPGD